MPRSGRDPPELISTIRSIDSVGALADFVTGLLDLTPVEKQEILDTVTWVPQLDLVISRLSYRHQVLTLSHDIGQQTRQAMEGRNRKFLLGEQLVSLDDAGLNLIIDGYTREAGVRNLEREIGAVFRNVAVTVAEGERGPVVIDVDAVSRILGARMFDADVAQRVSTPGTATGLAWTSVGGDILFIEANRIPGSGKLILTGELGDVMKENWSSSASRSQSCRFLVARDDLAVTGLDAVFFITSVLRFRRSATAAAA